jgi:hypothetical protein
MMAAVAHSAKFAHKVGIPQSVGKEFNQADKGTDIRKKKKKKKHESITPYFDGLNENLDAMFNDFANLSHRLRGQIEGAGAWLQHTEKYKGKIATALKAERKKKQTAKKKEKKQAVKKKKQHESVTPYFDGLYEGILGNAHIGSTSKDKKEKPRRNAYAAALAKKAGPSATPIEKAQYDLFRSEVKALYHK